MGICSGSQNVGDLSISWRAWKRENRVLGPPQRFWYSRSRARPENMHFHKGPKWCWCCFSRSHTLKTTETMSLGWEILFIKCLIQTTSWMLPSCPPPLHVLKAKEIDDKNELMTLDLNEIELNAIIFGLGFSGSKPKEIILWKETKEDILSKWIFRSY